MPTLSIEPVSSPAQLQTVQTLAQEIWLAHYPGIITHAQIRYMLASGYAVERLAADLNAGVHLDLLYIDAAPAGFSAYAGDQPGGEADLHKLYLLPAFHGLGAGSTLLQHVEDQCRLQQCASLTLNVNKHNHRAVRAYRRNGFSIIQSVYKDIGAGFYMDDFVMTKLLRNNAS
jgi:ribosomal protein S18 acetylase RimI-like enzyme